MKTRGKPQHAHGKRGHGTNFCLPFLKNGSALWFGAAYVEMGSVLKMRCMQGMGDMLEI
jgi:hypothetical protein